MILFFFLILVGCTLLGVSNLEAKVPFPTYQIIAGVQVSPEQKKLAVSNPASVAKPSNTSITDTIESVVSAAREDDTSKDSASSISKSGMDRLDKPLVQLPVSMLGS